MTQEHIDELRFEREKWKYRRFSFIGVEVFCALLYACLIVLGDPANGIHTNGLDGVESMAIITLVTYFGGAGASELMKRKK